ncbi:MULTISPECIES: LuxR C-terminal-related transcriptional regulator [Mumia]|uniref:LuxR C-terminal-related transcriptional regulator n=1 Tax=Mumia xiangluensis TaxID=1678900 RepID=A0ABW1QQ13_9ACTN|nr:MULTISPECIES: LuxR C-terminal-related transcriptional regulator [Mumia]
MKAHRARNPQAATSFGRDDDVDAVVALVRAGTRLVTLTGRAGVGKTHLAYRVADTLAEDPGGTVAVVHLAEVVAPERVLLEIAVALDVVGLPRTDLTEAIVARIGDTGGLLVLDNLEHVLPATADIARLLDHVPALSVLATSQTSTRLDAEKVLVVRPLPADACVDLYAARAAAIDSRFTLDDPESVATLCDALEGLPLAIELAAARSAALPAAELLRLFQDRPLDVLASRRVDVAERHRGLHSAIAWTYDRLTSSQQRLLRRISVAPTTVTIEDVEALADSDGETAIDELSALVDYHLADLVRGTAPARYALPSSIRAFALAELRAHDEHDEAVAAYVAWLGRWARDKVVEATTLDEAATLKEIGAATETLVQGARTALALGAVADAVDITLAAALRWAHAGYHHSHQRLLGDVLREAADLRTGARSRLTALHALMLFHAGDPTVAPRIKALLDEAEDSGRAVTDDNAVLEAHSSRALTSPLTGDFPGVMRAVSEGLPLAMRTGNDHWIARFELLAAAGNRLAGDDEQAIALATSAYARAKRTGYGAALVAGGAILRPMALSHPELGVGLRSTAEDLVLAREIELPWYELALPPIIALEALDAGELDSARESLIEALTLVRGSGTPTLVGYALVAASEVAAAAGEPELALMLDAAVEPFRSVVIANSSRERAERHASTMERCRAELGPEAGAATAAGSHLMLENAVQIALSALAAPGRERKAPQHRLHSADPLTERQMEVLLLLATGLSNKEISARLFIAEKTTMHHCAAIYQALGVRGRTEAVVWAAQHGMISPT